MPPLTGIVELYGPEITWAAKIACEEINRNGGVLGCALELVILDDGSLPDTAVHAANRLIDEYGCVAMIGNLLSNSRIAVSSLVSEPRKIPYLNFSFYEGSISGRYFFHFAALPNQQIDKMIPYMAENFGPKMFFAGNNYEWPRGSIDAAKRVLLKEGGEIVGEEYLSIGAPLEEIERLLVQVSNSGADVFVPYFAGIDQIHLLTTFTRMGLKKRMAVVMGHYDEAMVNLLEPEVREGFFSSNTYFMSVDTPKNRRYLQMLADQEGVTAMHPQGNGVVTNFGEGTYICMHAFAKAANLAGSTAAEALVDALENISVEAPQGVVTMDPKTHHAAVNTYLSRCTASGTFEINESFGQNAPVIPERYKPNIPMTPVLPRPPSERLIREASFISKGILDASDIAVIATDRYGIILQANKGAKELFFYLNSEIIGLSVSLLVPPHYRAFHEQAVLQFVLSDQNEIRMGKRGEITGYRKDGTFFPAEASISKFKNEHDEWIIVVTLMDISGRKRAEEELTWRATHDHLTSLPNRALIKDRLINALTRTRRSGQSTALLFIDLDKFKLVNDTYGHEAGDQLLIKVAKTLSEHVRPGDTVGRLGGDEFVILCENINEKNTLFQLAERINDALRTPLILDGKEIVTTASIGLAMGHGSTHSAEDLLRESDTAMYASKQQGRDRWRLFSEDLAAHSKQKLEIESGLRNAIEKNEFELYYQPIVSVQSANIQGMEALIRWKKNGENISPELFIPIAEESGMIVTIGKWVFERACALQAKLLEIYGELTPYISVNLSARQLDDDRITAEFDEILKKSGADPKKILIELTETSIMTDADENLRVLRALSELGMSVAVDDFGTGYSSLLHLLRLPVSHIKIDRAFVDGLDKSENSKLITSAIIKMAKVLDKKIIAEGVENKNQLYELTMLGADSIQGYYYFRPMPEENLLETLRKDKLSGIKTQQEIYTTVYVSKASETVTMQDIDSILKKAREFNFSHAITGCLIFSNGYFMQLIEGKKEIIDSLMLKIFKDPRHSEVMTILKGVADTRVFGNWSMAYWNPDAQNRNEKLEVLFKKEMTLKDLSQDPKLCYAIFKGLARQN